MHQFYREDNESDNDCGEVVIDNDDRDMINNEFKSDEDDLGRDGKRYRTNYSRIQISRLEQEFRREKYLSRLKRTELAKELALKESTIKVWFQNRRMKEKRQLTTINIPQILANSDPFLYSYLLDSAKAYYSFTSQLAGAAHTDTSSTTTNRQPDTEAAAIAAFMATHKLSNHMLPSLLPHNTNPLLLPHSTNPQTTNTPNNKSITSTSRHLHMKCPSDKGITFRPYIDS